MGGSSRRISLARVFSGRVDAAPTIDDVKLDALAPDCKNTLIEIDLGQRTLLLQAWNIPNRDLWIKMLREWAAIRRRQIDNQVYGSAAKTS